MNKNIFLWLIVGVLLVSSANAGVIDNSIDYLKEVFTDNVLVPTKLNEGVIENSITFDDKLKLTNDLDSVGKLEVENSFESKFNKVKHIIVLENKEDNELNLNGYSLKITIPTNEIKWNGTIYKLTDKPLRFQYGSNNIFFGENNARINFKDITDLGGYAIAYDNIIELKIDNINLQSGEKFLIDPSYYNQTEGFSTIPLASTANPMGITTNGSDFWMVDNSGNEFVFHTDRLGNNITDGFSTLAIGSIEAYGITILNGTDFWISDYIDRVIYHTDILGNNQTDSIDTKTLNLTFIKGITNNGSDFWLTTEATPEFVYNFDKSGNNLTKGFDMGRSGADQTNGITTNGSDFWVVDQDDLWIYHVDKSGNNITDGFSTADFGSESPRGITIFTEGTYNNTGTPTDFYITDTTDAFVYHLRAGDPSITLAYPIDGSESYSIYVNFTYNVEHTLDYNITSCSLYLNNILNQTDSTITVYDNQTFNVTLGNNHYYNWTIECISSIGIRGNSTTNSFIYNTAPTIPSTLAPANNTIIFDNQQNLTCAGSTDGEDDVNYVFYGGTILPTSTILQNSSSTTYSWESLTSQNYYWRCEANDNITSSGSTGTRNLVVLGVDQFNVSQSTECNDNLYETMCWDYKDEDNRTVLDASIAYNFKIILANSSTFDLFGSHDNTSFSCLCVNNTLFNNYSLNYGEIQYSKVGYSDRRYYAFTGARLTNLQVNDTLFLLTTGQSTSFLFEFVSTAISPYENYYTTLNRWYPGFDTYDTVDMGLTDNKGQTIMRVLSEDVDYRVGLYNLSGSLIKLLDPIRFACLDSPCTYSALIEEYPSDYIEYLNVETNGIEYSAGIFTLVYNDPSQNTEEMSLEVYKETGSGSLELCTDSATGYTGVLTCDVSAYTGQLRAIAYRTASPEIPIAQRIVNTASTVFKGNTGLFVSLFLFLVLAFIGALYGPAPTLIFGVIALIPAVIFGTITSSIVIGIGTLVGIAIHFMKRIGP